MRAHDEDGPREEDEEQVKKPHTSSLTVFRRHIDRNTLPDGTVVIDASRIHSLEAYQDWLESRGTPLPHNPAHVFQRTLTAHLSEFCILLEEGYANSRH